MISITTKIPGTNDAIIINNEIDSQIRQASARISKTKTLDGGVVVLHNGYAAGDRNLNISASLSKMDVDILWDIFTTQTFVTVATDEGVFNAVIKSVNISNSNETRIIIELESKLS